MMKLRALSLTLITLSFHLAHGKVYDSLDSLPTQQNYDFIVVGGGTAGSVVASRLTENPHFSVLLVEAGPNNEGVLELQVPGLYASINSTYSWNYVTEPQPGLNNRSIGIPRGHVLGGSSSINGMVYTRGASDVYDLWAKVTGDSGWTWDSLFPVIKRHERWLPPVGGRDISGEYDPKYHGFNGNTQVSLSQSGPNNFDSRSMQTTRTQSKEFPYNSDPNSGSPIGLTWTQSTIGHGERSSAATAYLDTQVRSRSNLDIVLNTQGTRILQTSISGEVLDIRTVVLAPRSGGRTRKTLVASKELILSAGSINSPQLLLSSGIGDRDELEALGINTILHLPDVGKGLSDHLVTIALWNATGTPIIPPNQDSDLEQWKKYRTGPLTEFAGHNIVWARIPSNATVFENETDPSAGKKAPHIEISLYNVGTIAGAAIVLLTPKSRGSVKLRSTNPFDPPRIDLGYFTHPFDLEAVHEGTLLTKRFFSGPEWSDYIAEPVTPDPDTSPRAVFDDFQRGAVSSTLHPTGTTAMSARGSKNGVLDSDLRVKGVKGLRVVDAGAFPQIPTGHPSAGVYILAERAVDIIRSAW